MVASSPMPSADRRAGYRAIILAHMIRKKLGAETGGASCVDGPRLARDHLACSTEVACSHVSGLLVQSGWTAGPDGVREPSPHHSNGIDVPMKRQASLGCVGIRPTVPSRVIALSQAPERGSAAYAAAATRW